MQARAFVGAVLAPHHAEDAELGVSRLASQQRHDFLVFVPGQLVLGDQLRSDRGGAHTLAASAPTIERRMTSPSVEPISGSVARSGCGIRPSTLRSRLSTPAMSSSDPLGLSRYRNAMRSSASS